MYALGMLSFIYLF